MVRELLKQTVGLILMETRWLCWQVPYLSGQRREFLTALWVCRVETCLVSLGDDITTSLSFICTLIAISLVPAS